MVDLSSERGEIILAGGPAFVRWAAAWTRAGGSPVSGDRHVAAALGDRAGELIAACHRALTGTRGAVATVAEIDRCVDVRFRWEMGMSGSVERIAKRPITGWSNGSDDGLPLAARYINRGRP